MNAPRADGFTLLELVMVLVLVALASIPVLGQFSQASTTLLLDETIQTASQLAQERAEGVLELRRASGFAAISTGTITENPGAPYNAYSRSVTVNSPPTGSGCAVGSTCKEVIIGVNHSGRTRAEITFLLVDY